MRFNATIAVIACVVVLISGVVGRAQAASPGASGLIAFHQYQNDVGHIWVMNPDGSGKKQITSNATNDVQPVWSPDGRQIAFTRAQGAVPGSTYDVWVMNADGTNQRRVTSGGHDASATWSPDGNWLTFDAIRDGQQFDVYAINVNGSGERNITNSPANDTFPMWSPDGSAILFESDRDGNTDIWAMNADGASPRNLTNRTDFNFRPDWSPDGAKIAFSSRPAPGGNIDIWTMNADGSGQARITNTPGADALPSWTADGSGILFVSDRNGNDDVYSMLANGSAQTRLTTSPADDEHPDSQPLTCTVASVIDGDSFTCVGGRTVNMLNIDAPELGACGGDWAKAALEFIFLTPGRVVRLQYDVTRSEFGADLAAPIWIGNDGNPYNLSIVMVYVGLAKAATVGAGNTRLLSWAQASQTWAQAAQWNMWAPGKTFNGGC